MPHEDETAASAAAPPGENAGPARGSGPRPAPGGPPHPDHDQEHHAPTGSACSGLAHDHRAPGSSRPPCRTQPHAATRHGHQRVTLGGGDGHGILQHKPGIALEAGGRQRGPGRGGGPGRPEHDGTRHTGSCLAWQTLWREPYSRRAVAMLQVGGDRAPGGVAAVLQAGRWPCARQGGGCAPGGAVTVLQAGQ